MRDRGGKWKVPLSDDYWSWWNGEVVSERERKKERKKAFDSQSRSLPPLPHYSSGHYFLFFFSFLFVVLDSEIPVNPEQGRSHRTLLASQPASQSASQPALPAPNREQSQNNKNIHIIHIISIWLHGGDWIPFQLARVVPPRLSFWNLFALNLSLSLFLFLYWICPIPQMCMYRCIS